MPRYSSFDQSLNLLTANEYVSRPCSNNLLWALMICWFLIKIRLRLISSISFVYVLLNFALNSSQSFSRPFDIKSGGCSVNDVGSEECGDEEVSTCTKLHVPFDPSGHFCDVNVTSHFGKTPLDPMGQSSGCGRSHFGYVPKYPGGHGGLKQLGKVPTNGRRHFFDFIIFLQSGNVPVKPNSQIPAGDIVSGDVVSGNVVSGNVVSVDVVSGNVSGNVVSDTGMVSTVTGSTSDVCIGVVAGNDSRGGGRYPHNDPVDPS